MCTTCGCGHGLIQIDGKRLQHSRKPAGAIRYRMPANLPRHTSLKASADYPVHKPDLIDFGSGAAQAHASDMSQARMVKIERDILAKNNLHAEANRCYLTERGIFALNLVSSPGSGKTTLLVQTIAALREEKRMYVIEGDQQTENDAARIRACGIPALQINTGKGCHLDAYMVSQGIQRLAVWEDSVLFIENVGNLVCPASFDLGEAHKVVILSVTEGEDKPLKYPDMFRAADLLLLNKCDLLPYLTFDPELAINYARRINPSLRVIQLSALRGEGMSEWIDWIKVGYHQVVTSKKKIENSQHHVD